MIVGGRYPGDSVELSNRQQDVYHHALRKMIDGCRKQYAGPYSLAGIERPTQSNGDVDHRTIQQAHDILAAAWRFVANPLEPTFGFKRSDAADISMSGWLIWLEQEIASWASDADLVPTFRTILENQNEEAGYAAERRLAELLYARFHRVPWAVKRPAGKQ